MNFGGGLFFKDHGNGRVRRGDVTGKEELGIYAHYDLGITKVIYLANSTSESVTAGAQSLRTRRMFRGGAGH